MYKSLCFSLLWLGLIHISNHYEVHAAPATTPAALRAKYKTAPVVITKENIHLLEEAGLITEEQKEEYIRYFWDDAPLRRLDDLLLLPSWRRSTIKAIRPYVKLPPAAKKWKILPSGKYLFRMVPFAKGEQQKDQEGHEAELVGTYILKEKGAYDIGLLAYKGVGEPLTYAFYRCYVVLEEKMLHPLLKRMVLGKYNVKVGQGLVLNSGAQREAALNSKFGQSKNMLTPAKSQNRNDAFTGGALHFVYKKLEGLVYMAYNPYFATLYNGAQDPNVALPPGEPYVQSLSASYTLYRNKDIRKAKSKFNEKLLGGAVIYHPTCTSSIGSTYLHSFYNHNYNPSKGFFNQRQNKNASVFAHWKHKNHYLIGELALSSPGKQVAVIPAGQLPPVGIGFSVGNKITLGKNHQLMCHYGHYAPNFHCFHGNSNSHINKKVLALGYQHPLLGSTLSHTLQGTQNIFLGEKDPPYKVKHEIEISYKWDQKSTLSAKYKATKVPTQPFLPTLKLQWKYATKFCTLSTALAFVSQLGSTWYKMISCSFCENLVFRFTHWTVKFHLTLFYTKAKAAFYHYTPDIKSGTLFPKIAGKGIRLGLILIYRIKDYLVLQWQCYSAFGLQASGKPIVSTPYMKCQLVYNA